MLLNILNISGIFLLLISLFLLIVYLVKLLFNKTSNLKRLFISMGCLMFSLFILLFVQHNSINIENNTKLYSNINHVVPLSINLVSGAQVQYNYNKKFLYKGYHDGNVYFKLNPLKISRDVNLIVKQKYYNSFLVPTISKNNIRIVNKH